MKRLFFSFLFIIVCNSLFAQFVVTPNGLEKTENDGNDYYVIDVPNCSQSELYTKTLQFITQIYVSPKDVISSQVENETIAVTAMKTIFYDFDVTYKLIFKFKDGRVRFDLPHIISMKKFYEGKEWHLTYTKTESLMSSIWIFKKNGELRGALVPKYKEDIENIFNPIYNNYKLFLTDTAAQKEEEDW